MRAEAASCALGNGNDAANNRSIIEATGGLRASGWGKAKLERRPRQMRWERWHGQGREHNPERERIIEELEALRPAFEEKMAAEEAQGDFRRRRALEELEEVVRRRMHGGS